MKARVIETGEIIDVHCLYSTIYTRLDCNGKIAEEFDEDEIELILPPKPKTVSVDKALKWLKENYTNYSKNQLGLETFMEDFKNAMDDDTIKPKDNGKEPCVHHTDGYGCEISPQKTCNACSSYFPKKKHKFNVGDKVFYKSFGKVRSMIVADIIDANDGNPMYESEDGNAVFESEIIASPIDYDKLNNMLEEALAKETKESWNEWLQKEENEKKYYKDLEDEDDFLMRFGRYPVTFEEYNADIIDAFRQGRYTEREQIMKDAVEIEFGWLKPILYTQTPKRWDIGNDDKVDLVVVKRD